MAPPNTSLCTLRWIIRTCLISLVPRPSSTDRLTLARRASEGWPDSLAGASGYSERTSQTKMDGVLIAFVLGFVRVFRRNATVELGESQSAETSFRDLAAIEPDCTQLRQRLQIL